MVIERGNKGFGKCIQETGAKAIQSCAKMLEKATDKQYN